MKNDMELTVKSRVWGSLGIMDTQMEKSVEDEMETGTA